ncbi:MAG: hypothetical protein ACO3A4_05145 [Silvanigrellaceae bacterium]
MADIRVNGRRMVILQSETRLQALVEKLDNLAYRNKSCLTAMTVGGRDIDLDNLDSLEIKLLGANDVVEARIENTAQLSFESLQVAQEMAELLVFDIKVATLRMWDSNTFAEKELSTLLKDCHTFLTLGAHPLDLLQRSPLELSATAQECLMELDRIAHNVEDATLLAVHTQFKDACHVLVGRVMPTIEKWLGLTAAFAKELEIDRIEKPALVEPSEVIRLSSLNGSAPIHITR